MARDVLGHIDCPTCGTKGGMRITHDRNGHPFGYCEAECSQQLRIGGDQRRVQLFLARYPWAAGKPAATPGDPAPAAPAAVPLPVSAAPTPAPQAAKPKASPFDPLAYFAR
ncbi:hypothetical protein [Schlegelella aquatica]|uniref:hypothetical protein n=1 Tax=Caldimonas aquatica TaxID=376175 RepID=UPI003751E7E4